jgi:acetyltransferase-like isoleucine patch superfamily enzyme
MPSLASRAAKLRDPAVRAYARRAATEGLRAALRGHRGAYIQPGVTIRGPGEVILHPGSRIRRDARIYVGPGARLEVHPGGIIGIRATVNVETEFVVGPGCELSWDVEVMDTDFHNIIGPSGPRVRTKPVHLGRGVLVGARAIILKGANVGDGAVVAAGAVVTGDVAPGTVVAGNPARVVGEVTSWK